MTGTVAATGFPVRWEDVRFAYPRVGELESGSVGERDVLDGVTLGIAAGEAVALLGPNGAGKTTLTRMLMGLVRPREGRVLVGDWDVARHRPHEMARRVGYAFQHADQQLFARCVQEDVAFGPTRLGIGTDHISALLDELALLDAAGRHPYDLPAPMRKLVSLAGVLAMRPGVLVLDEPTAGMDRGLRATVIAALTRRVEAGVTLVAISHDRAFVDAVATRKAQLENGRIVADAPPGA